MDLSQRHVRFGKYTGLGWAAASAAFLFDPEIGLVELLPTFIGYLFLTLSLMYWRDLSPHFESAWKKFRLLAFVSGLKFVSFIWVFGGLSNNLERPTMMLLLSFSFAVVELILGIPAWRSLTEGFIIHSQTARGEYPLRDKKGRNVSIAFRNATVRFMVLKAFFSNISEFAVLSEHTYDDTSFDWSKFVGLFRTLALFVGVIIGAVWLVRAISFWRGILKDKELIDSAKEKYEATVLPNTGLFIKRKIGFLLSLICAAALATPDFYLDSINFIPDTLTALLLIWAFIKLKPYFKNYFVGIALSAVYGAVSIWGAILSYGYVSDPISVRRTWENTKVYAEFWRMYPVRVAEALLFLASVTIALWGVCTIIKNYCGYVPENMDESYRTSRLAAIQKEVGNKVTLCFAMAALTMLTGGLYELILSFDNLLSEIWWLINFCVSAAFFASAVYMMYAVSEEVESRYMLD